MPCPLLHRLVHPRACRLAPVIAALATFAFAGLALGGLLHAAEGAPPDCTCRFQGEPVPLGQRRCLATPLGPRTAECVMEQNVTSWRPTGDICPQASLRRPAGAALRG